MTNSMVQLLNHTNPTSEADVVECSPKADPCVMRVSSAPSGKEILNERQEAQLGTDHQEAA
jgi:hypothetical protein